MRNFWLVGCVIFAILNIGCFVFFHSPVNLGIGIFDAVVAGMLLGQDLA